MTTKVFAGKREKNPNWKGGRRNWRGYWFIYMPEHPSAGHNGYVREHRLAMEKHLGRYLERKEHIHHIDFDKTNNKIENLFLIANGEHMTIHNDLEKLIGNLIRKGVIKFDREKREYS